MVARVTRLVAEKFVLSTFPRALTTLSSMCSGPGLESSPGLIDDGQDKARELRVNVPEIRERKLPRALPADSAKPLRRDERTALGD